MRYFLIITILILTNPSFSQVDDSVLEGFFSKREITQKHEIDKPNVALVSQHIGIWAPQDVTVLFQDSIVNRGDIGKEPNKKRKYLEENLSKIDFNFIDKQILDIGNSDKWTAEIHKDVSLINFESYESGKLWIYTIPLFNKQLDFCIVKISYYCGNKCAFSSIYSYRKNVDELWQVDKMIYSYMPWSDYQLFPKEVVKQGVIEMPICSSKSDSLYIGKQVKILDKRQVYDYLCQSSSKDTDWPNNKIKRNSGVCSDKWNGLENGSLATIVWRFEKFKSSSGDNVFLIKIDDHYVPIGCSGMEWNQND
jgi:hypothetical protein